MTISAKLVQELRKKTGAGIMDCKQALAETKGDLPAAVDRLRKQGVEFAAKKSGRATDQGWVGHYVHSNGKIGVLIEVFCETDFVAKNEVFQQFIKDLSMQIAAMSPLALKPEDLDPELVEKEREVFLGQMTEKDRAKPEEIQAKMIEGKMKKWLSEICLLHQTFVKDETKKKSVQDVLTDTIATLGENMSIGRFVRIQLGEG